MTEEIAKLEADLNQKHEEELKHLKSANDTKVNKCPPHPPFLFFRCLTSKVENIQYS